MTAIDRHDDIAINAIALLAKTAIVAEHASSSCKEVYDHPRSLEELPEDALPALVVYCRDQQDLRGVSGQAKELLEVLFEYKMPSSAVLDERGPRWPTLRMVWRTVVAAMRAGDHEKLPPEVLDPDSSEKFFERLALSVVDVSGRVRFQLAKAGGEIDDGIERCPIFRGTLSFEHYPNVAIDPEAPDEPSGARLYKFLGTDTTWRRPGADANTPGQPGFSTGEGPVITNLPGHPDGLPEPTP